MADQKFDHESLQDITSIRAFLNALVVSVENKRLTLTSEGQEIVMDMKDLLKFTLKARKKSGVNKLTIKIAWSDVPEDKTAHSSSLSVSS